MPVTLDLQIIIYICIQLHANLFICSSMDFKIVVFSTDIFFFSIDIDRPIKTSTKLCSCTNFMLKLDDSYRGFFHEAEPGWGESVNLSHELDDFVWSLISSGVFSVKFMYANFMKGHTVFHRKYFWKLKIPSRIKILFLCGFDRQVLLLTKDNLAKRH